MIAKLTVVTGGLVAAALAVFYGAGVASADTDIWVGGNTDCTSQGYMEAGANPPPGTNNVPVVYSTCDGSFAPFLGSTRADEAIRQGVEGTRREWNRWCSSGQTCRLHGFSVGAAPVAIVGNDVGADTPGSNTHVITEGNAWGYSGVFGEAPPGFVGFWINVGAPAIGVPLEVAQVPNSENRLNPNDGWANNSGQTPWGEITQLSTLNGVDTNGDGVQEIPPQHFIQTGEPTAVFRSPDGVEQKIYGEPFPGVVAPQNNPLVNPPPVLADPMEAFGQQMAGMPPCIAPDGGEYRTPAGVGC